MRFYSHGLVHLPKLRRVEDHVPIVDLPERSRYLRLSSFHQELSIYGKCSELDRECIRNEDDTRPLVRDWWPSSLADDAVKRCVEDILIFRRS